MKDECLTNAEIMNIPAHSTVAHMNQLIWVESGV